MSKRIMIFDDDKGILAISRMILEDKDWEVHTFEDCNNIIERVRNTTPDLIIMDNQIPDGGGINATRLLKEQNDLKHIPVIYFSAHHEIEKLAQQAGANSYLSKPLDLCEFEDALIKMS